MKLSPSAVHAHTLSGLKKSFHLPTSEELQPFQDWANELEDMLMEQNGWGPLFRNLFKGGTRKVKLDILLVAINGYREGEGLTPPRTLKDLARQEAPLWEKGEYDRNLSVLAAELSFSQGSIERLYAKKFSF